MEEQDRPRDRRMAELADRQHSVVAYSQLSRLGLTRNEIDSRVTRGFLHRLHRGVYAVGHRRLALKGRWMAAVLACGPAALLSHRAAVTLWELRPASGGAVDVTVPGRTRRGQKGILVHSVRALDARDRRELQGIPVTSVCRALLDYAEVASLQRLRLALEAAERRDLLDLNALDELIGRSRGRHGLKPLRAALGELRGPAPWTQSELENRFLALIREAGMPEPQVNVVVAGILVDFFWPRRRLVVEADGYRFHKTRRSFEGDRVRDAKLQVSGYRVLRVTYVRIVHEPAALLRDLRALLAA